MIEQAIAKIKEQKPTIAALLESCPFDSQKNLNTRMSEELFFDEKIGLYCDSDESKALRVKIKNGLFSGITTKRLLFLYGYSGIGKSTFLRKFVNDIKSEYNPVIIDFQEVLVYIKSNTESLSKKIEKTNPILLGVQQHLLNLDDEIQEAFFVYLKEKKSKIRKYLSNFYARLNKNESESEILDIWQSLLLTSNFNDSFILLFLFLFFEIKESKDEKTIIIFDNLDSIKLDYFSKDFKELFPNILNKVALLSQDKKLYEEPINFVGKFKFVFCMREANNAQINSNNSDTIWNNKIEHKVIFSSNIYEKAFLKRFKFVKLIYKEEEIQNLINVSIVDVANILKKYFKDFTFSNIFLPLFNYDFRKLTITLFNLIIKLGTDSKQLLKKGNQYYAQNSKLFHGLISNLAENNYIKAFYDTKVDWDSETGYCHPARMILTKTINYSNIKINNPEKLSIISEEISFFDIVSKFNKIYDPKTIVDVLTNLFKHHKDGWVHPITIKNKLVKTKQSFKKELELLKELKTYNDKEENGESLENEELERQSTIKDIIEEIKIKHNPASFALLRFIIPNYDYYLAINKIDHSLFDYNHDEIFDEKSDLNKSILKVYQTAENHIKVMRKFLTSKFIKPEFTIEDYRFSTYSWKYIGARRKPELKGFLHSERIINSHIGHLNEFRHFITNEVKAEDKARANRIITTTINKYNELYKGSLDQESVKPIYLGFKTLIDKILTNPNDFDINIKL